MPPYYKYRPLPSGWIRLLQIHDIPLAPGGKGSRNTSKDDYFESDLLVTLQDFPLADCPQYVALSYTWGLPTVEVDPTTTIFTAEARCYPVYTTSDHLLRGTHNLRTALRRIRQIRARYEQPVTYDSTEAIMNREALDLCGSMDWFWIDALCINQDDLDERADQVIRMRQIYQQSHVCVAWLGEADAHSQIAERLLWDIFHRRVSVPEKEREKVQLAWDQTLSDRDIQSLLATFTRNWFSRIWVLQEVLLARQTVALWGSTSFILVPLLQMYKGILEGRGIAALETDQDLEAKGSPLIADTVLTTSLSTNLLLFSSNTALLRCKTSLLESKIIPRFYNVMEMAWQRRCADPRDCIYGVLGITREFLSASGDPVIDVDYTLQVETVYVQATAAVAYYGKNLDFLIFVSKSKDRNFTALPSWCPDYSVTQLLPDFNHNFPSLWKSEPEIRVLESRFLEVEGILFDVVDRVHRPDTEEGGLAVGIHRAVALLQLAASTAKIGSTESLARMLLMDQIDIRGPAEPVAAVLLPLGLIKTMKLPLRLKYDGSLDHDTVILSEALGQLYEVINLLQLQSSQNMPYLPKVELFRQAFEQILQRGQSTLLEVNLILEDIFMLELNAIDERASSIGLLHELRKLLGNGPRYTPRPKTPKFYKIDPTRKVKIAPFLDTMLYRIDINLQGTILFLTQRSNELGFGYHLQEGDEIWMLNESMAPVVLQRSLDTGYYKFKGQLYVSGLMRGEICEERDKWIPRTEKILIQ